MAATVEDHAQIDAQAFRDAMAAVAASVAVLTVDVGGDVRGVTISSLIGLSLEPLLVLFALRHGSSLLEEVRDRTFGLSVLAETQRHIAQYCAAPARPPVPRAWVSRGADGRAPTVHGGALSLEVARCASWRTGDHIVVVARVLNAKVTGARPLIYHQRAYCAVAELPLHFAGDLPGGDGSSANA